MEQFAGTTELERDERDAARQDANIAPDVEPAPWRGSASALTPRSVLALQSAAGNRAVARVLGARPLARTLQTSTPPQPGPFPPEAEPRPAQWLDLETIREETKAEIIMAFATAVGIDLLIAEPQHALHGIGLAMVLGGPALYLFGESRFRRRLTGKHNVGGLVTAAALLVLAPIGMHLSALGLSLIVGALLSLMVIWERPGRATRRD
jgi:Bacterial low temperature requirement A protein (LtrA)